MAEPTIQLGGGNWAGKTDNLLGYYKEGERFYKQDFTFSRSTTGTYTDKDGYIQEMPYNLATYSEDFSNASWVKSNVTIETSINTSPLGYSQKIVGDNNTSLKLLYKNNIITPTRTISALVKAEGYNYAIIFTGGGARVVFDLLNGVVGHSIGTFQDASINSQGDGWYIISMSNPNHTSYASVTGAASNSVYDRTGNGIDGISLAYIQVNKGTSAKTYFPTTTRLNMPRVDYLNNSNGSLILEPQRSNLLIYSQKFSQWSQTRTTNTDNEIISPDGSLNSSLITENTTLDSKYTFLNLTTTTNEHTLSFFAKYKGRYLQVLFGSNDVTGNPYINFDLENGSYDNNGVTNPSIENYGNGWYKCTLSVTPIVTSNFGVFFSPIPSLTSSRLTSYQGDGTSGVYLWGAQLEQGSYPTTLINTSGSSVTRNQDACSLTNVADRIGQTEGTMFIDIDFIDIGSVQVLLSVHDGASNKRLEIWANGSVVNGFIGGSVNIAIGNTTISEGRHKLAVAYNQSGDQAFYVDGVQVGTSSTAYTIAALTQLSYNLYDGSRYYANGSVNQTQIYNTRLSNSELATLTTL